jgi:hypothetical protein
MEWTNEATKWAAYQLRRLCMSEEIWTHFLLSGLSAQIEERMKAGADRIDARAAVLRDFWLSRLRTEEKRKLFETADMRQVIVWLDEEREKHKVKVAKGRSKKERQQTTHKRSGGSEGLSNGDEP